MLVDKPAGWRPSNTPLNRRDGCEERGQCSLLRFVIDWAKLQTPRQRGWEDSGAPPIRAVLLNRLCFPLSVRGGVPHRDISPPPRVLMREILTRARVANILGGVHPTPKTTQCKPHL